MDNSRKTKEQLRREIEDLKKGIANMEGNQGPVGLHEQAIFQQLLLDSTMDGYIIADSQENIIGANQAYCDLMGYSMDELMKMKIGQLNTQVPPEIVNQRTRELLRKGRDRFEVKHQHKNGKLLDLEATIIVFRYKEQTMMVGFMRDISERIKALEALKDSEYLLKESQKVARLGSYTLDLSTQFWSSSPILDEIFGIKSDFQRDLDGWLQIIHPDDRELMREYFETTIAEKQEYFNKEYRIKRINNQELRWVHGLGELEYKEDGTPVKMIGTIQDITGRKGVEEKLQESELRFRSIIEQAADALLIVDFTGKILVANQSACNSLGYTRDELLSMHLGDVDANFYDIINKPGNTVVSDLENGKNLNIETTYRRKDGTSYPAEVSIGAIEISNSKVILGFVRDISKRKEAEEGLLKMSKAISNSSEVIFLTDLDGIITYINPEFTRMYGFTAEEVVGKVTPRILKSGLADIKVIQYMWNTLLNKQSIPTGQYVNKRKDGKLIDVEASADPVLDENGNLIGFLGIQRDITKRKRTETIQKVLFHISNAANSSDNLINLIVFIRKELSKVIDTTHFYMCLYDEKTDILTFPLELDEKGNEKTLYAASTLSSYLIKNQEPLLLGKEEIKKKTEAGSLEIYDSEVEQWLGVPLKFKGKVTGVLVVQSYEDKAAFDEEDMQMLEFVSDQISISISQKQAEQELKAALEKATESDRLKSAFLASMSHELRTPLNAIIGFSDIFSKDLSAEEMLSYASIINSSGNQLLSIVEDLFDITLIEAGEIKIRQRKERLYPIMEYIQEIMEVTKQNINNRDLELKLLVAPEDKDVVVFTDTVKLKQILINLLKNALKFTSEGHVHFGYQVQKMDGKDFIKFKVEDTGTGIPEHMHELIFDVFRQIDSTHTRSLGGTGIGLSIARKMTELLGGKIWLESVEGEGSVFYFTIPLEAVTSEGEQNDAGKEKARPGQGKGHNKTILIVEDDEPSMIFLKILLRKLKVQILWAKTGLEAISFCKDHPQIDLVLMDINMPEMDGYEATREIKKFKPELPILAQTANAVDGDKEQALEAGCDDYIAKPIKKELFIITIEKYLGRIEANKM
jgi:PAS domain S-box-containing protein